MKKNERTIHEIDAAGVSVGRLTSRIATLLRGKHKPVFDPAIDCGDAVVVRNASKIKFTGRKLAQKDFRHHTMYPGGLKVTPMKKIFLEQPGEVIRHAVMGMLPKNNRRPNLMKRLKIEE